MKLDESETSWHNEEGNFQIQVSCFNEKSRTILLSFFFFCFGSAA